MPALQSDRAGREERWSQSLRNELEDSEVELVTRLGSIQMAVSSLIDMRPGDIIPFDFDGHATVLSDGIPLFTGDLGQQRGMQVVRVSENDHTQIRQRAGCIREEGAMNPGNANHFRCRARRRRAAGAGSGPQAQ